MRDSRSRFRLFAVVLAAVVAVGVASATADAAETPGAKPTSAAPSAAPPPPAGLAPFTTLSGKIYQSVDAFGTNDPASGALKVHKNNAATTVKAAYLLTASTGFSGYTPVSGDVVLNGTSVTWDPTKTLTNGILSVNVFSDVTSIVKPVVDAAAAGDVSLSYREPLNPASIDGSILAVILTDPSLPTDNTVSFLYGALATTGDNFAIGLAEPIDLSDPNLALAMSLGISFGYQPTGQITQIDVNGSRLTTSAGGQDDSRCKLDPVTNPFSSCGNGELITAGGIGDSTANPPNPNATDTTCAAPGAPRCDDELYNLKPFVANGDTLIAVNTLNPSNDDNVYFAGFQLNSAAAVVGEGAVLSPVSATNPINTNHTLTAKVQDSNGNPITGKTVTFAVLSGPRSGLTGTDATDANGEATFTYTSPTIGTDTIEASFQSATGATIKSNQVTKTWIRQGDNIAPTCRITKTLAGPPKGIEVSAQDTGSGLASIMVTKKVNANVVVPVFAQATTAPVVVKATRINNAISAQVELTVTDKNGNKTVCDPVLTTVKAYDVQTFTHLPAAENVVTIVNADPGLRRIVVHVNRHRYVVRLQDGEKVTLDVSDAVEPGDVNRFRIRTFGPRRGTADVTIWDGNGDV